MKFSSKFSVLVSIYAISLLIWFILWLTIGDGFWWMTYLNPIFPYLFVPVPVFLTWAIVTRQHRTLVPLLAPVLIFGWLYHPYLFPRCRRVAEAKPDLTVMTYNVLYSNTRYNHVADVILLYHPDLIALEEVQPEMMAALRFRLAEEYPYSIMGTENNFGTTAVFSRTPFVDSYVVDLQADRPATVVKTVVAGHEISFVAVHLIAYNLWWTKPKDMPAVTTQRTIDQNRQAGLVLKQINDLNGTVIVGCDCNSYETSSSYRMFERSMRNSARETGLYVGKSELPGVKQDNSLRHIDYVWYRGALTPVSVYKIIESAGSDHLPVLAIFQMK